MWFTVVEEAEPRGGSLKSLIDTEMSVKTNEKRMRSGQSGDEGTSQRRDSPTLMLLSVCIIPWKHGFTVKTRKPSFGVIER